MIYDYLTQVSTAQDLTLLLGSTTVVSDDSIPLLVAKDIGQGSPLYMQFYIGTGVDSNSAVPFFRCSVIAADDAALTTNVVVLSASDLFDKTVLAAGWTINLPIGRLDYAQQVAGKLYLGAKYENTVADDIVAGTISARILLDAQTPTATMKHAAGYSIT